MSGKKCPEYPRMSVLGSDLLLAYSTCQVLGGLFLIQKAGTECNVIMALLEIYKF